jgi:hypothetical protein
MPSMMLSLPITGLDMLTPILEFKLPFAVFIDSLRRIQPLSQPPGVIGYILIAAQLHQETNQMNQLRPQKSFSSSTSSSNHAQGGP